MSRLAVAALAAALAVPSAVLAQEKDKVGGAVETVSKAVGGALGSTAAAASGPLGMAAGGLAGQEAGKRVAGVVNKLIGRDGKPERHVPYLDVPAFAAEAPLIDPPQPPPA